MSNPGGTRPSTGHQEHRARRPGRARARRCWPKPARAIRRDPRRGALARGTTVCDFDPQEKALLHSLDAAICGFERRRKRVNVVDTPGYPDFSAAR